MKKTSLLLAAISLAAAPAMASSARMLALGQYEYHYSATTGQVDALLPTPSNYLADFRDAFWNPAYIMVYGDQANFETGGAGGGITTTAMPYAEGGATKTVGNFK